ncbi:MAG: flagellar hook-basal body complex protein FliE [Dissulfurispiraceae bacterium]|jgi:flagellar hook-basal body complex protein FliE|nr:flagellar hook-basal body complex protein FliE [Dissulfurispiraceae bacterium]
MSEIKIPGIPIQGVSEPSIQPSQKNSPAQGSFADAIKQALDDATKIQNDAEKAVEGFAKGEVNDIHTVVLAMQKADLSLQTMLQVRNKLMSAYEDIMKMQV